MSQVQFFFIQTIILFDVMQAITCLLCNFPILQSNNQIKSTRKLDETKAKEFDAAFANVSEIRLTPFMYFVAQAPV